MFCIHFLIQFEVKLFLLMIFNYFVMVPSSGLILALYHGK